MKVSAKDLRALEQAESLIRRFTMTGEFPLGMSLDMLKIADFLREDLLPRLEEEE